MSSGIFVVVMKKESVRTVGSVRAKTTERQETTSGGSCRGHGVTTSAEREVLVVSALTWSVHPQDSISVLLISSNCRV